MTASSNGSSITSISCTPVSNSQFVYSSIPTQITCTALAANGGGASCAFTIRLLDVTLPTMVCPAAIVAEPPSGSSATAVSWEVSAFDVVGLSGSVLCNPLSGNTFNLGNT